MVFIKSTALEDVSRATELKHVQDMLQNAVALELATLPTYLTGVFSIKPGTNEQAKALIQSVCYGEMLHLTLASNLLISIGGNPAIYNTGTTGLIFPTPLPNFVDPSLMVDLASMTPEQVHRVYMGIEHPDTTAVLPGESERHPHAEQALAKHETYNSIGDFYNAILEKLEELLQEGERVFENPREDRQIDIQRYFPPVFVPRPSGPPIRLTDGKVKCMLSARAVVGAILAEGEGVNVGTDPIDPTGGLNDTFAHYFKFAEIFYGKKLIQDCASESGWSYNGESLNVDFDNVYSFRPNTKLRDYEVGSAAYYPAQEFYDTYLRLLRALDDAFNGKPQQLKPAVSIMYELKLVANKVVPFKDPLDPTCSAAPPFMA